MPRKSHAAVLAAVLLLAVVLGDLFGGSNQHARRGPALVTVPLATSATPAATPSSLRVPAAAVAAASATDADDHDHSRSEQPAGVSARQLDAAERQQERLAVRDDLPAVTPLAAPEQAGCRSRFISSYSSRRGVAPRLFVLHYTVSPNQPGFADVDGITAFFARAATQASSNYVIDADGNCNYIVPESAKAWTQATFNPVSVSVEVVATGSEGRYAAPAGLAKIARVAHDAMKRWGIPLQMGKVSGCTVVRPGLVTHEMLGACGGGHHDISPYSAAPVLSAIQALDKPARHFTPRVAHVNRVTCRKLNWWRHAGRPHGQAERNAIYRRKALARRGVTCTARGPLPAA